MQRLVVKVKNKSNLILDRRFSLQIKLYNHDAMETFSPINVGNNKSILIYKRHFLVMLGSSAS